MATRGVFSSISSISGRETSALDVLPARNICSFCQLHESQEYARKGVSPISSLKSPLVGAAIAVPDEVRREEVLVFIKLAAGSSPQDCKQPLAAFKLPRYITYVEDFPRTAIRKIAKIKLDLKTCIEPIFDNQEERYLSNGEAVSLF